MTQISDRLSGEQLSGSWNQIKGKIREKWGQLTDDDLERYKGNVDQLVGYVQEKTGQTRRDIEGYLSDISGQAAGTMQMVSERAGQYAQRAGEALHSQYDYAAEATRQRYLQAEESVRQNPGAAVAVAFGAGLLFGLTLFALMRGR
ncbi:MAG: CsbD family protein [Planctomycetota bacterium]